LECLLDGAKMAQQARASVSSFQVLAFDLIPDMRHIIEEQLVSLRLAHRCEEVQPDFLEERLQVLIRID
ncbi:hypothetical protein K3W89_14900, partial [Listeria monocytogenes]|nr:hypothetical protein [Listeria monocytogenes]